MGPDLTGVCGPRSLVARARWVASWFVGHRSHGTVHGSRSALPSGGDHGLEGMSKLARVLAAVLTAVLVVSACGGSMDAPSARRELLVSAAASLTDAFAEIEREFERATPGVDVVLNLGGSSLLREQILSGAPVGVFASADPDTMKQVGDAGYLDGPYRVFAHNRMAIAVPRGNPAGVRGLDDLGDGHLLVGLCAEMVPCGDFARQVLAKAGIRPVVDTEEPNVRALLTKVAAGELDLAVVYVTDIAVSDSVEEIPIADDYNVATDYPIAVVAGSPDPAGAEAFVVFVLSEEGRRIMARHGFSLP